MYRKSIKPVNLGGVAGGTKYLVHGVLYKFAEGKKNKKKDVLVCVCAFFFVCLFVCLKSYFRS